MFRTQITKSFRSFSTSALRMAEGDVGGVRSGGAASGDAFTKREQSQEAMYVKQKEHEKLIALKAKLNQQRQHLDDLEAHIDEITKSQGGEQN